MKSITLTDIPEWFKNTKLKLLKCFAYRNIFQYLPENTIFYKSWLYFPILNREIYLDYNHIRNFKIHYGVEFQICNCNLQSFCGKDFCSSLNLWLPEYEISIIPNEDQFNYIMTINYPQMHVNSIDKLIKFLERIDDQTKRIFLTSLLCIRNINNKYGRWSNVCKHIRELIRDYIKENSDKNEDEKIISYFESFLDMYGNVN